MATKRITVRACQCRRLGLECHGHGPEGQPTAPGYRWWDGMTREERLETWRRYGRRSVGDVRRCG